MKKIIRLSLLGIMGIIGGGGIWLSKLSAKYLADKAKQEYKNRTYYSMLSEWLALKIEGNIEHSMEKYLEANAYKSIAIYGFGKLGMLLYEELKNSSIEIKYIIDKNAKSMHTQLKMIDLDHFLGDVDAVIVTPVTAFDSVKEQLDKKGTMPILSLQKIIYDM